MKDNKRGHYGFIIERMIALNRNAGFGRRVTTRSVGFDVILLVVTVEIMMCEIFHKKKFPN